MRTIIFIVCLIGLASCLKWAGESYFSESTTFDIELTDGPWLLMSSVVSGPGVYNRYLGSPEDSIRLSSYWIPQHIITSNIGGALNQYNATYTHRISLSDTVLVTGVLVPAWKPGLSDTLLFKQISENIMVFTIRASNGTYVETDTFRKF